VTVEVRVPQWGMGIAEATVVQWVKAVGDHVEEHEPLVELETAKATDFINAPASGVLTEIVAAPGMVVPVGEILATIDGE